MTYLARDKRHRTKRRGITYRETARGRSYYVSWDNNYLKAGSTMAEAVILQESLRKRGGGRPVYLTGPERMFLVWLLRELAESPSIAALITKLERGGIVPREGDVDVRLML